MSVCVGITSVPDYGNELLGPIGKCVRNKNDAKKLGSDADPPRKQEPKDKKSDWIYDLAQEIQRSGANISLQQYWEKKENNKRDRIGRGA